jgi:hypothetical protein
MAGPRLSIGSASPAFTFVLMMGVVDFFGDMTYSGGASMNGPFLGSLGAGAAIVSIAGGSSEFLSYLMRGVSGYVADKTGMRWPIAFIGYTINLITVPAMALAGHWMLAAALVLLQGIGRGCESRSSRRCSRTPPVSMAGLGLCGARRAALAQPITLNARAGLASRHRYGRRDL